jgi:peptide/nickel transport system substrate-binding protein
VKRLAVAGALAAALALLLAAAGAPRAIKEGGTFRMAVAGGWFGAADPALPGGAADVDVLRPACGALLEYPNQALPAGLRLAPGLADSYPEVSKDGKTYTFTIRRKAKFSTGAPVTATAVAHSLERVLTPAMRSGIAEFFGDIVGARAMLAGKATSLAGATARGRRLTLRLVKRVPDFAARISSLCVGPANLPIDPEGAKPPIASAAPYYVSEYVPGEQVVLERNRFYRGLRPHHVDRITVDLGADTGAIDQVFRGELEYVWPVPELNSTLAEIARRYGINRSRFFVEPGLYTRMFFLNTSRPLFRGNVKLRQAVNFAVDRKALTREVGPYVATATDQYLPPALPAFRNERIYPLAGADLRKARALAKGRTRAGKALLYTCDRPDCVASAQILQRNLKQIGLEVMIQQLPTQLLFEKIFRPGEPFDIAWVGWGGYLDPGTFIDDLFLGSGGANISRFNDPEYNRAITAASRLSGADRYRAYGDLDVKLARDAAPAIAYASLNAWAVVSSGVGCVIMNPFLDLTAVCLK